MSSHDIIKEVDRGIDQPETDENEKVEDNDQEEENEETLAAVENLPLTWRTSKYPPIDNIVVDITRGMTTRSKISKFCYHFGFVSQVKRKNDKDALLDDHWHMETQDGLNKFIRNNV